MVIRKTSVAFDDEFWKEWTIYTIKKKGSSRKASELLTEAAKEYMKNHPTEE